MAVARIPQGPHVALVDTESNQVLSWAEFEPVYQGDSSRRFSVSPKDEKVRQLAAKCREMRQQGKKVELRFVV